MVPMRRLRLGRLARWLLGRLLRRRLDRTAGGRRLGRRGCLAGWRRGGGGGGGALAPLNQLRDPVHDEGEEDQNSDDPRDDPRGLAIPGFGLGLLVERILGIGERLLVSLGCRRRLKGWRGFTRWRLSAKAVIGVLRLLIVEVVRWAIACHGIDRTDTGDRRAQNVLIGSARMPSPRLRDPT